MYILILVLYVNVHVRMNLLVITDKSSTNESGSSSMMSTDGVQHTYKCTTYL